MSSMNTSELTSRREITHMKYATPGVLGRAVMVGMLCECKRRLSPSKAAALPKIDRAFCFCAIRPDSIRQQVAMSWPAWNETGCAYWQAGAVSLPSGLTETGKLETAVRPRYGHPEEEDGARARTVLTRKAKVGRFPPWLAYSME